MPAVAAPAAYDVAGPADAPAIVLIHGTRLSRAVWAPQVAGLSDEFRLILPDLPGHGRLVSVPFSFDAAADAIERVIDEAAGGWAVVAGLSLGGYVALTVAARSPERVRGLVVMGASCEPVGPRSIPYRALELLLAYAPAAALDAGMRRFYRWRYPARISEPIISGGFWSPGGIAALAALRGRRFIPLLASYPGPVLILNGSLDLLFRLGERSYLAAARRGRLRVVGGAAHLVNLDRPDAVSAALRDFVNGPVATAEAAREG
jgi:pimeloyl-ACP methyl ester carboxylesterase